MNETKPMLCIETYHFASFLGQNFCKNFVMAVLDTFLERAEVQKRVVQSAA